MKAEIRPLAAGDVPAAVSLIRRSFATVAEELGFTEENAPRFTAFAVTEERLGWQMEQEHRPMLGLFAEGEMVGYYSLCPLPEGGCELNNLCVRPDCRHDGLGAALLWDAFARAAEMGCGRLHIGIIEENRRLRAWYEGFGFVHTGTEKLDFFPFTCGYMERRI